MIYSSPEATQKSDFRNKRGKNANYTLVRTSEGTSNVFMSEDRGILSTNCSNSAISFVTEFKKELVREKKRIRGGYKGHI